MTLTQYLIKKGVVDKKQAAGLEYDIKVSGRKEEEVIVEKGIIPEDLVFELKGENLKVPVRKVSKKRCLWKLWSLFLKSRPSITA